MHRIETETRTAEYIYDVILEEEFTHVLSSYILTEEQYDTIEAIFTSIDVNDIANLQSNIEYMFSLVGLEGIPFKVRRENNKLELHAKNDVLAFILYQIHQREYIQ